MHIILRSLLSHRENNCICFQQMSAGDWEDFLKKQQSLSKHDADHRCAASSEGRCTFEVTQTDKHRPHLGFPVRAKCSPALRASFVRWLLRFFLSPGWHNQRVSVVWSGGSTHTQSAVTRSRVRCFSMEISCVSSLDYCSGCQNPHRYTSYTPSHVHTHSIASPNQALCVLSLLLVLSLWSFTEVWFFIPFHSSTSLFLNPPPALFLILRSFRLLSSHYHSPLLPRDPLFFFPARFFSFFLSFWAQHASS